MRRSPALAIVVIGFASLLAGQTLASAPQTRPASPTVAQFLGPASPIEVTAATRMDRVAWIAFEQGRRNVYTAAPPQFAPVRLTAYMKDDGVDLTDINLSADGSTVVFLRGSVANRQGWNANPSGDPKGGELAIWAARVANPGLSWRVAEGSAPQVSPDGSSVLFVKDGQIHRARVTPTRPLTEMDRGETPFIRAWGTNSNPSWSPDGRKIAFVTNRTDHGFVGVYDVATRKVKYVAPDVDFDTSPIWSADSKHIVFIRRPGVPFGQQSQQGAGAAAAAQGRGGRGVAQAAATGQAGRGQGAEAPGSGAARGTTRVQTPGMMTATFKGGHTLALWKADVATGEGHEIWRPQAGDPITNLTGVRWAGDHIVFPLVAGGGRGGGRRGSAGPAQPIDEWDRYYSLNVSVANAKPVLLTPTDGLIEDQAQTTISADGKTFYYCTNAKDIERRHIWAVPTAGGVPHQITTGDGIETYPAVLASGTMVATLSATWNMPQSLGIWSTKAAGTQRIVFPTSRPGFPADAHVEPQNVLTKAPDGLEIHNQLFLPRDIKPGEKRPAIVFVHGGPARQMLLGYHYRYVYHQFYAFNEYLASRGYIVLSVNYRSGVGYGRSFRTAPGTESRGNSEYQDVVAGAKYLQTRPDVDPKRVGIYGLSYGGLLTAQALARNSDIFVVGVDYAGVHMYDNSLDPEALAYQSSAISQIDKWKSPVLLIQGDDDRNVAFSQTVGLVQLLRQRDVYYELIVQPDDVHDSLLYSRWLHLLDRSDKFLQKFLSDSPAPVAGGR
jgi:dipeptidyl-peptidase-4